MNDFSINDIVVCIDNTNFEDELSIGYEYKIIEIIYDYDELDGYIIVFNNLTDCNMYRFYKFMKLKEYIIKQRKDKVKKLLK